MRHIISRPARALLPVSLALCAVFLPDGAQQALMFMAALLIARGLSLCAGGALRGAAGAVVRASRLRGNLLTAAGMAAFGSAATIVLSLTDIPFVGEIGVFTAISGAFVNIAQVFADRMYASEDRPSAIVYDCIIAALTAVGLIISGADKWLFAVLTGSGMLAGILLLAGLKNGTSIQKGFGIIRYTPAAIMRGWLFQAAMTVAAIVLAGSETDMAAAFIAVTVLEWCEPVYRRNDSESGACGLGLAILSAVWVIFGVAGWYSGQFMPEWYSCAPVFSVFFVCIVPAGCFGAAMTGLALTARRIFMAILMPAGIFLSAPDIADLRRIARAKRLRKKRR